MQMQVNSEHYDFNKYVNKGRWNSFYHQINEITSILPPHLAQQSILEVGVGSGILKTICKHLLPYNYESLDVDEELKPDHIGSILKMPFADQQYDIVVCFQVLEHMPYESFTKALSELFRVAKKSVIISLPNANRVLSLHIQKICPYKFIKRPFTRTEEHKFDGEHYWEINKKGYEIEKIIDTMSKISKTYYYKLEKNYRVWEKTFHHFFVFKKQA